MAGQGKAKKTTTRNTLRLNSTNQKPVSRSLKLPPEIVSFTDSTGGKLAEKIIQERDLRFQKFASQVPGMIYQFLRKPDGTYSVPFSSDAIVSIFGCSPEDVRHNFSPIFDVIVPEDREKVISTIDYSAANLTQWKCEYRVQIPGQPIRWLWGQSMPEKLPDGSILWHGFNTDITERKKIEAQLQITNRLYDLLSDVNQAIVRIKDREELFQSICKIAVDIGKFRMAWIGLVDEKSRFPQPVTWYGYEDGYLEIVHKIMLKGPPEGRPVATAVRTGQLVVSNDIEVGYKTLPWLAEALKRGYRSLATIPLKNKDTIVGNLSVYSDVTGFFTEDMKKLLVEIGSDISYGLESIETEQKRRQLEEELKAVNRLYAFLSEINQAIVRIKDRDELFRSICQIAINTGKFRMVWIGIIDENSGELKPVMIGGHEEGYLSNSRRINIHNPEDVRPASVAIQSGKVVISNDIQVEFAAMPRLEEVVKRGYHAIGAIPLKIKDNVIGSFTIFADKPGFFTAQERKLLEELGADISYGLEAMEAEKKRKQAEQEIQAASLYARGLIEASLDPLITINSEGQITDVNEATIAVTGLARSQLIGTDFCDYFTEPDRAKEGYQTVFAKGLVKDFPLTIRHTSGKLTDVLYNASLFKDEKGVVKGVFAAARDITDRKHLEEERQRVAKLESVGILAGGIAHDFNNILTSILGNVNLACMKTEQGSELNRLLKAAEKASLRAKDLTQQLLTFARGGIPVKKSTSIVNLIQETAGFVLRGSNITCRFYMPADLWLVEIDEGQISQVINNLVLNARQAMPLGGTIEIHAQNITLFGQMSLGKSLPLKQEDYIRISVVDHGTGIPPQYLDKIFDPYFTTKQSGSGLGLATSYSIIRNHDGYIDVESSVNSGSTFYVYLPASEKRIKDVETEIKEKLLLVEGRILVMDDEEGVRDVAGDMLKYIGYKDIEFARDGVEAIKQYTDAKESGKPFDVVILDLTISGGMGGKEVIQKLLEIDPQVKAIVSSGYAGEAVMAEYQQYGFKGVVAKPYTLEQLSEVLSKVIRDDSTIT